MRSGLHNPSVAALTGSTVSCPFINFLLQGDTAGTQHVIGTVSNEATIDMGREVWSSSCTCNKVCDVFIVQAVHGAMYMTHMTSHCNAPEQLVVLCPLWASIRECRQHFQVCDNGFPSRRRGGLHRRQSSLKGIRLPLWGCISLSLSPLTCSTCIHGASDLSPKTPRV